VLRGSSKFRSNGRLPAITWVHPQTKATLSRCAQPHVSFSGYQSAEDERLVSLLNTGPFQLLIVDARDMASATANSLLGGGTENPITYNCEYAYSNIGNIHAMQKSFRLLTELSYVPKTPDRQAYENTKWLSHIGVVLQSACNIVEAIQLKKQSVLVHCTDGWDRTSQLVSLAQIFLDPYYRTLEGFANLIQKDWLSFGHQFSVRLGHGITLSDTTSPPFVQWMDCVFQCLKQFPNWFQFNEHYLIAILDEIYSCRFGNFLFDNERTRKENALHTKTPSLWPWIVNPSRLDMFINFTYIPENGYFTPQCSSTELHVWTSYYGRYRASMKYYKKHHEQTISRLQPSLEFEASSLKQQQDFLRTVLPKMFNKEIQQEIETMKKKTNNNSDLILEFENHKFRLSLENNKIKLSLCPQLPACDLESSQNESMPPEKSLFCATDCFVIEDYHAPEECVSVVMGEEELEEFLTDVVNVESTPPLQPQGLAYYVPNHVMNLYDALPSISTGLAGPASVARWWYSSKK